ncbi:MAG: glycosyltransferase [Bacteroidota bacterium]
MIVLYVPAIGWLILGVFRLPRVQISKVKPDNKFSLIVPFRNEEGNLATLLQSIDALEYPTQLFEVILVNDASEDKGEQIIWQHAQKTDLNLTVLQNKRVSGSPKKDAIRTAIEQANNKWIITTDADCELSKNWLYCYDELIQKEAPKMICGPVVYNSNGSILDHFQFLDGLSLQGVAMGSFGWKRPFLCNGANMAYEKSVFEAVKGYEQNDHIASGDDIFLLEKVQSHFPNKIAFLKSKEAVVITKTENSWSQAIQQRIRWASKTTKQKNTPSKVMGVIVFMGNLAFLVSLGWFAWDSKPVYFLLMILGMKMVVDLLLLKTVSQLLAKPISLLWFLVTALIYPLLILWVIFNSLIGSYQWKGRNFKK